MTAATEGYGALLRFACVDLGWCGCIKDGGPLHVDMFIPETGQVTSDQFAEWLCLADDIQPADYPRFPQLKALIKEAFIRCLGADVVDAKRLRQT